MVQDISRKKDGWNLVLLLAKPRAVMSMSNITKHDKIT